MAGFHFTGLTETLQLTLLTDETFGHTCNRWINLTVESPNKNSCNTRPSVQNQVLPHDKPLSDVERPVTMLEELRYRYVVLQIGRISISTELQCCFTGSHVIFIIFCVFSPFTLRLVFLKRIYLTLSGTILIHFNKAFGLSLLFYLISKLISASIGCHGFLHDLVHLSEHVLFWIFTNVSDTAGIFVLFQSADYVRGEVSRFPNNSCRWFRF